MIIGTGLDFVEVSRVQKAAKNDRFYTRNFTQNEMDLFESKQYNMQTVAGNFAAKEAVLKCLGSGLFDVPLIDIEVLRKGSGQPFVKLHGKAQHRAAELGVTTVHVSITHIKDHAAAQAIAEKL